MDTRDAYGATGSPRWTADLLPPHRSGVARRLGRLAKALGVQLTEPAGLLCATVALTAWRLLGPQPGSGAGARRSP
ncbi:hypothetical protein FM076_02235 [Streptomyces albus subsp. chlorinus]|uniref:hypothetical protein n=1 Tax=Streptomyces albus TaxID=1888 RepID=UPI00156EDBBF|nr:hypothetical protein [Streptomyces albus]NSC20088.1 hypothetical protein [Streptomyces albus subsp. chlorinus]